MATSSPRPAFTVSGSPLEQPDFQKQLSYLEADLSTTPINQARFLGVHPQKAAEVVRLRTMSAPQRMQEVRDTYAESLKESLPRLRSGFAEANRSAQNADPADTQETPVEHINAIAYAIINPPKGAAPAGTHRYLTEYDLNYRQIEADQSYLRALAGTRSDLQPDLLQLDRALRELMYKDPRNVIRQLEKRHEEDNVDGKIYKALQGGVFVAAAFAAVLGLGVGIAQRKLSGTTFFYAGVALLAYPGVWDQLFSGKDKIMVKEINGSLNDPLFQSIRQKYNVQGIAWANYARNTLEEPTSTKALISALKANNLHATGPSVSPELKQQITDYVRSMGGGKNEKKNMQLMIDKGDFVDFARILLTLHNEDAQAIACDYIKTGGGTL